MSGNGKEGEKDGRGRGRQQGGDNSKFTCPTILQRSFLTRGCQLLPQQCFISDECNTACIQALPLLMLEVLLPGSISISFTSPTHKLTHTHTCVSLHIQIYSIYINIKSLFRNAPSSPVVKNLPINAKDMSLIPGPEDSTCLVSLLVKPESPRGHALRQEKPPQ